MIVTEDRSAHFLWQSLEDLEAGTSSSRKASTFYGYWAMLKAGAKLPN
jgi:hypothetical protein